MNAVKDLLKSGKTVVGTAGAPNVDVSVLAESGFDFLLFDTHHSPWDIKQLQPSVQAMRGKKAAPIVRVSDNRADLICFALDAGARGVVYGRNVWQADDPVMMCGLLREVIHRPAAVPV